MKFIAKTLVAAGVMAALTGGAMAADLYVPPAAPVAAAPVASSAWDGPYIGASVGYGWQTLTSAPNVTGNGWLIGGQVGYNFHVADQLVLGVEGNLDWNNASGSTVGVDSYSYDWDGSVRARLGVDMGAWMPYAEAGVAFANITEANATSSPEVRTGWTAGAGVEVQLADHLTGNVEYRYTDYGAGSGVDLTDNSIRVGLNYHF